MSVTVAMRRHLVLAAVLAAAVAVAKAQVPTQADADGTRAKLALIIETGDGPRSQDAPRVRTTFTHREVNAYLTVYGPTFLPQGVTHPQVGIGDGGRVTARAIVDLDAVRNSRKRDWLDPMNYLTGSLEVIATGIVAGSNGTGMADVESATVAGISVPKRLLRELVRYYTTSPEKPDGFDLDEPFQLPANIRNVIFESGRATIIQ